MYSFIRSYIFYLSVCLPVHLSLILSTYLCISLYLYIYFLNLINIIYVSRHSFLLYLSRSSKKTNTPPTTTTTKKRTIPSTSSEQGEPNQGVSAERVRYKGALFPGEAANKRTQLRGHSGKAARRDSSREQTNTMNGSDSKAGGDSHTITGGSDGNNN